MPPLPLDLSLAEATEFLSSWAPGGPWPLVAIEVPLTPEARPHVTFAYLESDRAVREFITLNHERGWNLYFCPNLPIQTIRTSPTKAEMALVRTLHVDLDLSPGTPPTDAAFEALLARLTAVEPPATAIVFSGGGYQGFWRFADDLSAADHADRIENVNRALEASLGGDHCHNVNRLMRLPGTINVPNARKRQRGRVPARAYVVSADWSRTWDYLTDPVPQPAQVEPDLDPPDEAETRGPSVADLPTRLERLIVRGDASNWNNDRSRLVWHVVTALVRASWDDAAIRQVITDPAYRVSDHVRAQGNPDAYARRQIQRVRDAVAADWQRDRFGNVLRGSQSNVARALDSIGAKFSYNVFANRAYVNGYGPLRQVDDDATIELRLGIDSRFDFLPDKDLFHDVVRSLCRKGDFHPVRDYLDQIQPTWDQTARIGSTEHHGTSENPSWLHTYGGAEDNLYTRAVGRLILLAAVRRVRDPGCKFDEMLVFINRDQGTDKSTALQTLARRLEWFTDSLPLHATGKQVIEKLAGRWIVEASDLSGMRKADVEELKNFLSTRVDADRLAYDRYRTELPRQCVFFGTTNSEVFLKDDQNRRFWPVRVGRFDVPALAAVVDQLWAEAAHYEALGETIRLHSSLWPVAAEYQADARAEHPWTETLGEAFNDLVGKVVNSDVWKVINKPMHFRTQEDNRQLGQSMRELGFERTRARVDRSLKIVYARGTPDERQLMIYVFRDPITGRVTVTNDPAPTPGALDPSLDPANELPV